MTTSLGDSFLRLSRTAHADRLTRLVPLAIAVTWLPLDAFALAEWLLARHSEPLVRDLSVHARLLVALPLFVVADRMLEGAIAHAVRRLADEGYVPAASAARLTHLVRQTARWREAALGEAILAVLAVGCGVAGLFGVLGSAGALAGASASNLTAARLWYALVSLPLFQFVLWRSLFQWLLWARILFSLSRMPLRLLPAHADRRGGIAFLKRPTLVYAIMAVLATSSVLCASLGTRVYAQGWQVQSLEPLAILLVVVAGVLALVPLLPFVPQLVRARVDGIARWSSLVSDYDRRFDERWLARRDRAGLVGTPDIQSLADLGTAYREGVVAFRPLLFSSSDCLSLLAAAIVPALPLLALHGPAAEAMQKLLRLALGGLSR